ncbi:MAG: hypothetical protein ACLP8S_13410 [Solirubrobacteraceae bacterium]
MTREVPVEARELAARLAVLFGVDSQLVERLNDAGCRLRLANEELWSGLHPDAFGVVYSDAVGVAVGQGRSVIAERVGAALWAGGGQQEVETVLLGVLAGSHWAIHRAFLDYQAVCEKRRQLAVDVGELSAQLVAALAVAGWSQQAARSANVHELAGAR